MSPFRLLVLLMLVSALIAGEAPKPQPTPGTTPTQPEKPDAKVADSKAKKKDGDPFSQLAEEEKWTFDPPINRQDIFYDLEAMLMSQHGTDPGKNPGTRPGGPTDDIAGLRQWAKDELARVESFIFERKWDDALKATEADLKKLQPRVGEDATIA